MTHAARLGAGVVVTDGLRRVRAVLAGRGYRPEAAAGGGLLAACPVCVEENPGDRSNPPRLLTALGLPGPAGEVGGGGTRLGCEVHGGPAVVAALNRDGRVLTPADAGAGPPAGLDGPTAERGELLLARRFIERAGADFRHVPGLGWFRWVPGAAWRPCDLREEREAVRAVGITLGKEAPRSANGIGGALTIASSDPAIAVRARTLDADPYLLGTPGGVIDLRTGELRAALRDDLITRLTATAPADTAGEAWPAFLATVQPDEGARAFLQRLVGCALIGAKRERVLAILLGTGANGKSVFVTALHRALGDYAWAAPLALLITDPRNTGGRPTPELVGLRGRRFVSVSESPEDARLSVERVKAITGGDAITARDLHKPLVTFTPSHTIFLATNHRPSIPDAGPAIWERILLLPWPVVIAEADRDRGLGERLAVEEGPAVLRWAIDGAAAYLRAGLGVPPVVRDATGEYREAEDVFGLFLSERTVKDPQARVGAGALLTAYRRWTEPRPAAPTLRDAALKERMLALGYRADKSRNRSWYLGLRLLDEYAEER